MAKPLVRLHVDTPLGTMLLVASDCGLTRASLPGFDSAAADGLPTVAEHPILAQAAVELARYFADGSIGFTTPLDAVGTDFQQKVWRALTGIPAGSTCSYQDISDAIGNPAATRAVGLANGQNRLAIFVPCHRVIGRDGSLTGYAGGLQAKEWLLRHEGSRPQLTLF